MENFNLKQIGITGGFWGKRQEINATNTLKNVYKRFYETGRFKALKCTGEGPKAHIFWDSDIAKWLEAVAYFLYRREDKEIRAWYDEAVEDIVKNQLDNGYFNSYFQVYEPENVFTRRGDHELYCAGHLFEAAVAACEYLSDDRLLRFTEKFVDYIYDRFVVKKDTSFKTPGHEEIELALFRLYCLTGKEKYKELAEFFLNERGVNESEDMSGFHSDYCQSHKPCREQYTAEGHSVRALYLYSAMADMAQVCGDESMRTACEKLFANIAEKRMFVTGGVGAIYGAERFTIDYDLPNYRAYSETCAAIALVFFADRMFRLTGETKYAHVLERALYNGALSGVSLDGKSFFYTNPLEMHVQRAKSNMEAGPILERVEVFDCSCCPPNVCRFIEELPQYAWYTNEEKNELTLAQFFTSKLKTPFVEAEVDSNFPYNGKVRIKLRSFGKRTTLRIRKPEWCDTAFENEKDGYLVYEGVFDNEEIAVEFPMRLKRIYANENIPESAGKTAFSYGPLILCAEGADNPFPLFSLKTGTIEKAKVTVLENSPFVVKVSLPATVYATNGKLYAYEREETERELTLIPYFAWANRGANDMRIWF